MKRPNVLLISIDTLRADHLACYGYKLPTSPNIDQLGEDGVIYERAYSTAAWTPPAHASLLTGLYPSSHGTFGENRLSKNIPTIAEVLQNNGYNTAGFVNNSQVGELVGLEKGHEYYMEVWKGTGRKSLFGRGIHYINRNVRELMGINDHGAHRTNQLVRGWLNENKKSPFYIFIHYIEPHNPINPPWTYKNKYLESKPRTTVDHKKVNLVAFNPLICFTNNIKLTEEETIALKALYNGEIAYLDHKIGELIEYLKEENLYENTLIILTADHGEHFGEHGFYSHVASLYEEILHIPLIVKFPGENSKGNRADHLVQLIDIFPTVMNLLNLESEGPRKTQGINLLKGGDKAEKHEYIVAEWEGRIPSFVSKRIKRSNENPIIELMKEKKIMIRDSHYKLIKNSYGIDELYDLNDDRKEERNLVEIKKDEVKKLEGQLDQWKSLNKNTVLERQSSLDELTRKNLEALGYL